MELPTGKYSLIYADPPWQYRDKCHSGQRGAEYKYQCMSIDDICKLPVTNIAASDCLLAMWWVNPMPAEALKVVAAWGFTVKSMAGFTWHKVTKNGCNHFGMGNWTRANAENCLFAVRGKPKRASAAVSQMIVSPVGRHSEKPSEARTKLVALMGDVPRIELFTRQRCDGWQAWGNELEIA